MSEVQSRPSAPRGRGSARGGRGGFASRGGRGGRSHAINGDRSDNTTSTSIDDDGEVGQLKKKHGSKVDSIKDVFPGWTDEDAVMALEETDGDLETTIERIADGTITQWGEVSKSKKDKSKSKIKEPTSVEPNTRPSRGARGGFEAGRGGRGRGNERGRGSIRGRGGAAVAPTNGARTTDTTEWSVPTTESSAWETVLKDETPASGAEKPSNDTWGGAAVNAASSTAATAAAVTTSIIPEGVKKSWASMFAKPEPAPAPKAAPAPAPAPAQVPKPEEPVKAPEPVEAPAVSESKPEESTPAVEEPSVPAVEESTPVETQTREESDQSITPSKDELTETNLEQVLDTSNPAPTATAASTVASSWDPRNTGATNTPYVAVPQQSTRPAPASGFATSALKATGSGGRTASYQRRVLDQEEAVRMPGNRAVDSTAVQFGAFNLNGSGDEDVDGDREEPETRAQPPQHSPVAHPRASLPPSQQAPGSEAYPTPKQAPGLPSAPQQTSAPGLPSPQGLPAAQSMSQQGSQGSHQYSGQFGRFGQSGSQQPQGNTDLKEYDAFSRQVPTSQSPYDAYPSQPGQGQQQGAFSSAPSDYSSYYTADQHQRNAYQNYYGTPYGQQPGAQSQDGPGAAQRSFSGYGAPQSETTSQYPQSSGPQSQSRYATAGETQGSGHTTPNPTTQAQHQPGQSAAPQQSHPQQGGAGQYPYGHPYYSSPYYAAYMNQHYQGYGQGAYGAGPYGAKGGMYNQPQQGYGMSPATPYDHTSSPAAGSFGGASLHGRDSALGGLGDYGRTGSAQSSQTPQAIGGGAFGGMHDAFGRNTSYQGQNQHYGQQGAQQGAADDLKPFGDSKTSNGPSPSLTQAARPGSATSGTPGQTGLPPPQSSQQGYGGYPSHLQQQHALHGSQSGSQYGGLGGLGGHQAGHQNSQYGGYQGFGNSYYGNNQQRGGWGGNYGH